MSGISGDPQKDKKLMVENQEYRAAVPHVKSNYWTKTNHHHENESFQTWGRYLPDLRGQAAHRAWARLCCLFWHEEQEVWGWASSARLKGKDPSLDRECHEAPAPAGGCHHRAHWAPERNWEHKKSSTWDVIPDNGTFWTRRAVKTHCWRMREDPKRVLPYVYLIPIFPPRGRYCPWPLAES